MCEVMCDHWGYTKKDLNYKSAAEMIETLAVCRRYRSNFLLNVGPKGDGSLRLIDQGILEILGEWVALNDKAIRIPAPSGIEIQNKPKDFMLQEGNTYYLFVHDLFTGADENVTIARQGDLTERFTLDKPIQSVCWMDNGEPLEFTQEGDQVVVKTKEFRYGESYVVRIAQITVE